MCIFSLSRQCAKTSLKYTRIKFKVLKKLIVYYIKYIILILWSRGLIKALFKIYFKFINQQIRKLEDIYFFIPKYTFGFESLHVYIVLVYSYIAVKLYTCTIDFLWFNIDQEKGTVLLAIAY